MPQNKWLVFRDPPSVGSHHPPISSFAMTIQGQMKTFMSHKSQEKKSITQYLLRLLSQRDYTHYELSNKLRLKGFTEETVTPILADFQQKGFINDQRFAENFIHWRCQKGYGPRRISQELENRGIASDLIADLLNMADNVWFVQARMIWQKHFKNHLPEDVKTRAKQMRFLQSRGFMQAHIESIFKDENRIMP